jgi:hypothetical protein
VTTSDVIDRLVAELTASEAVRLHMVSVIWIGSRSHGIDVHARSDLDVQIVLDAPSGEATTALARILPAYPELDLSILYPKDVWNARGELDFQDGTKGPFFIPVLSAGRVMYGRDFYADLCMALPSDAVRASLRFTIREYLARLRVMAVGADSSAIAFKKYTMKFLKDALVYAGHLPLDDMPTTPNADIVRLACESGMLRTAPSQSFVAQLDDYNSPMAATARAAMVMHLEAIYDALDTASAAGRWVRPRPGP